MLEVLMLIAELCCIRLDFVGRNVPNASRIFPNFTLPDDFFLSSGLNNLRMHMYYDQLSILTYGQSYYELSIKNI